VFEVIDESHEQVLPREISVSGSSVDEDSGLLGCDAVYLVEWFLTFQTKVLLDCWVLKTKALRSLEMPGTTHTSTRHITEDLKPQVVPQSGLRDGSPVPDIAY
jgi:hypothetical protein